MKSRIVLSVLCFLMLALFSWSVSGDVESFVDDSKIVPATESENTGVELPLTWVTQELELDVSGLVCEETEPAWSAEEPDQLLENEDQQAFSCPGYFYQAFCSGCGPAVQQCLNEGQSLTLCAACGELCRCNAIDCTCF